MKFDAREDLAIEAALAMRVNLAMGMNLATGENLGVRVNLVARMNLAARANLSTIVEFAMREVLVATENLIPWDCTKMWSLLF